MKGEITTKFIVVLIAMLLIFILSYALINGIGSDVSQQLEFFPNLLKK